MMSTMELIAIVAGLAVLFVVIVIAGTLAIAKRTPDNRPRRARKYERAANQAEVEAWIARTKGKHHVKRMRGEA